MMTKTPRNVLLVGSVPLTPAAKVFETVSRSIGDLVRRIPDGEQIGWSSTARSTYREHPDLELSRKVPLNAHGAGDGLAGAAKRIAFAEKVVPRFGIASFCGLGRPPLADAGGRSFHANPPVPALRRATAETIGAALDLHRAAALV
jgi:hypothetical protein